MNADLKITSDQIQRQGKSSVTVFHLDGWLDAQSEGQLLVMAQEAYTADTRYLVLEMSEVDILTSAGMRAIQRVYKLFTPDQDTKPARMKLCNASPPVYHVLGQTGFLQSLPMYESLQAAIDFFRKLTLILE